MHGNPINKLNDIKNKPREERAYDLFEACMKGDIKSVRSARDARVPEAEATALMTASFHVMVMQILYLN